MYDKLNMSITANDREILNRLENAVNDGWSTKVNPDGIVLCLDANIANFSVRRGVNRTTGELSNTITLMGSIAKFANGNNVYALNRQQTREAVEKLCDILTIPPDGVNVSQLEFGTTFPMRYPVNLYFSRLGDLTRFKRKRLVKTETLQYEQNEKKIKFYDKKRECIDKKQDLPPLFNSMNLLRYEVTIIHSLAKKLHTGEQGFTLASICDGRIYQSLLDYYQETYNNIPKRYFADKDMKHIHTAKDITEGLFARLLSEADPDVINDYLEEIQAKAPLQDKALYRAKKDLTTLLADGIDKDGLINELNNAVANATAYV